MLLTAHHVRSPDGVEGTNAFCYLHGPYDWLEPPPGIPDENPGELVNSKADVRPGGNEVRAYLDVIAPDETPTSEILATVLEFVRSRNDKQLPWSGTVGRTTFRFGLVKGLETEWKAEFSGLLRAVLEVRVPL